MKNSVWVVEERYRGQQYGPTVWQPTISISCWRSEAREFMRSQNEHSPEFAHRVRRYVADE